MEYRVLDAPDVLIDRHPVIGRVALEHPAFVLRRAVAEEVPRGLDEGVHRVRLASRAAATPWAGRVHEAGHVGHRGATLAADLHVAGEDDGKVLFLLGDHAALVAVEDGNRRAPVPLPADAPVPQPVIDLGLTESAC